MSDHNSKTRWHLLLGKLLECLLTPVDIQVQVEPQLMSEPPRGDIILLRRHSPQWTHTQQALLADGIRDSNADHILLEFKYTESINRDALQQILGYEHFYRQTQKLKSTEIDSFLLSAKTSQAATLNSYGYSKTQQAGVYRSKQIILKHITLISLNDLADTQHNAWLRIFASKQQEKAKAFQHVQQAQLELQHLELTWFIRGLLKFVFKLIGEQSMKIEVTPEDVVEIGKLLEGTPLEESMFKIRMHHLPLEERLEGLTPEEILNQFDAETRLKGIDPKLIEAYLEKIKHN